MCKSGLFFWLITLILAQTASKVNSTPNHMSYNIDCATFPSLNAHTSNNNINSDQYYDQYTYTVTQDGLYLFWFSQRMGGGAASSRDFTVRITKNGNDLNYATSGGSDYVSYIQASVVVVSFCKTGDTIKCQSKGGGSGIIPTLDGNICVTMIA